MQILGTVQERRRGGDGEEQKNTMDGACAEIRRRKNYKEDLPREARGKSTSREDQTELAG